MTKLTEFLRRLAEQMSENPDLAHQSMKELGIDPNEVLVTPSEQHRGLEAMHVEINPERHDLIEHLKEKFGIDPKSVIIRTEDGMVTRERTALVFSVDFEELDEEALNSFESRKEAHDIDRTVSVAFHCLIAFGAIDEELKPICETPPLEYCLKQYGRHSLAWYCAKIATVAMNLDWYRSKAEEGELPVVKAIYQATQLGAWCVEFKLKFEHEENALRGMDVLKGAHNSAELTHAKVRIRTDPRYDEMKRLVPKHGVTNAARILTKKGMGSIAANRGLWYRRQK